MTRHICQTCGRRVPTKPDTPEGDCILRYALRLIEADRTTARLAMQNYKCWKRKARKAR